MVSVLDADYRKPYPSHVPDLDEQDGRGDLLRSRTQTFAVTNVHVASTTAYQIHQPSGRKIITLMILLRWMGGYTVQPRTWLRTFFVVATGLAWISTCLRPQWFG